MKRSLVSAVLVLTLVWSGCTPPNKNFTGGKLDFKAHRFEKAKAQFSDALLAEPQNPDIHFYMGQTLLELKDYEGARAEFDQCMQLGGEPYAKQVKSVVDAPYVDLYNDGKTYNEQGDLDKGIEAMNKAALLDPARLDAHVALGALYANADNYTEAAASLERAIALDPTSRDAYFNLGIVQYQAANYDAAIVAFKAVLERAPGELAALENLARCYQLAERYVEMVPVYQQIIQVNPDDSDAHYNYGVALVNAGETAEAIKQFEEVQRLKPEDNEALLSLCRMYREAKRWDEALAGLNKYIAAEPNDAGGYTEQARVYTSMADELAAKGDDAGANALRRKALDALTIAGNKIGGS